MCSAGLERGRAGVVSSKMVRAPCCQKMGLKKGPWTPEEDQILVAHIQRYGHGNWRALPKQAGLLRCGKSCRLRWTNYLRPDIKRGNFSRDEEETIIKLHELLGNRWSTIAARLPGRTDNEIKNVWHTHLKKRLKTDHHKGQESKRKIPCGPITEIGAEPTITKPINSVPAQPRFKAPSLASASPSRSYSDISSMATTDSSSSNNNSTKEEFTESSLVFPEIDVSFWSEALSVDSCTTSAIGGSLGPLDDPFNSISSLNNNDMSFWLRVFMEAGDFRELSEI